jgi:hypothetical protein
MADRLGVQPSSDLVPGWSAVRAGLAAPAGEECVASS